MNSILASLVARFISGPASLLGQWVVKNVLLYLYNIAVDAYEKYLISEKAKAIKDAEEKLKDAKTEAEVDSELENIARKSNN